MKTKTRKFVIELASHVDYKGMVVYVSLEHERLASISYDKGIENMEVEMFPFGHDSSRIVFPLKDFLEVLEKAEEIAIRCAKEDEEMRKRGIDI